MDMWHGSGLQLAMSTLEDREARIGLAKEKLKKFRRRKGGHDGVDGVVSVEESLSGAAEDLSARSSPSVDMQLQSQLHEETESAEGPGHEFGDSQLAGSAPTRDGRRRNDLNGGISGQNEELRRLQSTVQDLTDGNRQVRKELEMERKLVDSRILSEHHSLREQLNGHIQTIGILVAEKTELLGSLAQADQACRNKTAELEAYAHKLKKLHETVADHQAQLAVATTNRRQWESEWQQRCTLQTQELDRLKKSKEAGEKSLEEVGDELLELRKRLTLKEEERRSLEEKLAQVDQQSMKKDSSIHAQYTTLVDQHQNILREKAHVDSQLGQYQVQVTTLQRDMDQMISKYQRLVAQLTAATPSQPDDIQAKLVEKEELTDLLQRTQMDRDSLRQSVSDLEAACSRVSDENHRLHEEVQRMSTELNQAQSKMLETEEEISSLTRLNEQFKSTAEDRDSLLAAVESDKIALSRALTQNNQLKTMLDQLSAQVEKEKRLLPSPVSMSTNENLHASPPEASVVGHGPTAVFSSKAFEGKMRNLEDEVQMYKNRVVQADSEVIYLKNALRIREEEAKLLHLTERVGAYRNLEQRFVTAMRQNADAQDYVDQLEHLIMQLQGETETIGDYIALYQNQRGLQRRREVEKEAQLDMLLKERDQMKEKLSELSRLLKTNMSLWEEGSSHRDLPQSGDPQTTLDHSDGPSEIFRLIADLDGYIAKSSAPESPTLQPPPLSPSLPFPLPLPGHPLSCPCCLGHLQVV